MQAQYSDWLSKLKTDSIKTKISQFIVDDKLSFSEVKDILMTAASGGMNQNKFDDIKSLIQFPNAYDGYVGSLLGYVISGNTANDFWWGGSSTGPSSPTALGNLTATSSQQQTENLVNKWFTGSDVPQPIVGGDTAKNVQPDVLSYKIFNGPLFVSGASSEDVAQGQAGTCYYLSSLGAIAYSNAQTLENGFVEDNKDGSYTFRFYDINSNPVFITCNTQLPVVGTSDTLALSHSPSGELWVALAEKAYAQLNATGILLNSTNVNSYQAVEGGWAYPLKQITGSNYTYYTGSAGLQNIGDRFAYGTKYDPNVATYKTEITDLIKSGAMGWLASFIDTKSASGQTELVQGHAFMLKGYDPGTDTFVVRNPWGGQADNGYLPEFNVKLADIWNQDTVLAITNAALSNKSFKYSIIGNADTKANAVSEGDQVSLHISRDQTQDTASTIYYKVFQVADNQPEDVKSDGEIHAINLSKFDKDFTLDIPVLTDGIKEGVETFNVEFYDSSTGGKPFKTVSSFIKDTGESAINYTLKSAKSESTSDTQTIYVDIERDTVGQPSEIYLSAIDPLGDKKQIFIHQNPGDVTPVGGDEGFSQQVVKFMARESKTTVKLTVYNPDQIDDAVDLKLFKNQLDNSADSELNIPLETKQSSENSNNSFEINSDANTPDIAKKEGEEIQYTISRENSDEDETVYLVEDGSASPGDDFNENYQKVIHFEPGQTKAIINLKTANDFWRETTESIKLSVSKTPNKEGIVKTSEAFVKDSFNPVVNYSIKTTSDYAHPTKEGENVVFTISRDNSSFKSIIYVDTLDGNAVSDTEDFSDDYQFLYEKEVVFESGESSKQISVPSYLDKTKEGIEDFSLGYRTYLSDTDYADAVTAYITDAKNIPVFKYSMTNAEVKDGEDASITVTRSGSATSDSASTVYLYLTEGTASPDLDYKENYYDFPLTFNPGETSKLITIPTLGKQADDWVEEEFYLDLYKFRSDENPDTYATITLTSDHNQISGTASNDTLTGTDSIEEINGKEGNDIIFGGLGQDILWGGVGKNVFKYSSTEESTLDFPDFVKDFKSGDKIDLKAIDANVNLPGDQAFSRPKVVKDFDVESFTKPGQLVFDVLSQTLYGNVDSDPEADFAIALLGLSKISASDIIL